VPDFVQIKTVEKLPSRVTDHQEGDLVALNQQMGILGTYGKSGQGFHVKRDLVRPPEVGVSEVCLFLSRGAQDGGLIMVW
jgi:hypothetical protein